ncbi:NAD(+) diphosphatase [Bordetella genomosp. 13]|uniref:NAD(+) diphosphatase n=1 Tax=Bordetella genomosp. 13 TaxID=463040 RepID=A0A1W6ZGH2_9BORD|nr:NAD(+) diphosphatase [Bordetella genomosp. 13]ARP96250.1 NADH pyrophosphatase [Bordetella genomosp. 13]
MPFLDSSSRIDFGLNPLDRQSGRRDDGDYVRACRQHPSTRYFVFAGDVPVLAVQQDDFDPLFDAAQLEALGQPVREVFMGQDESGVALFAVAYPAAAAESLDVRPDLALIDLRSIAARGLFAPSLLGELGGAKAILHWHDRHGFCANCGAPSRMSAAGWRRDCDACGAQHFPRVDPVVIMLAIDGDRCVLGRQQRFAPGMYSALAGFLEPGETIEDAVRREVMEEAGIACGEVRYFASQPWPFPSSLMIGCFARAIGSDIVVDRNELEDARWFTRAEIAAMIAGTHPEGLSSPKPFAIAYHLMKAFVEEGAGVLRHVGSRELE